MQIVQIIKTKLKAFKRIFKKEKNKLPQIPYSKINLQTLTQYIKSQKNPHLLIGGTIFLILLIPLVILITKNPKKTDAWFNDSWRYRKKIPITYTGSENLTEYQVLVEDLDTATLVTAGKLQSDCDDLRFTSRTGIVFDYYIVPKTCNTSATDIWVKTDSINASNTDIYLYYGNSAATSYQNELNTFSYEEEKTLAYILDPNVDDLEIISLINGNSISHNSTTVTLDKYDTDTGTGFGGGTISQYAPITAKGPFNADDDSDNTDSVVPVSWAGTEFEFYSRDTGENVYLYGIAPWSEATITVYSNGSAVTGCTSVTVATTGSSHTCASVSNTVRVESDVPVILFTQPTNADDQMPLKPNTTHPWIGSGNTSRIINGDTSLDYSYYYDTSASANTGTQTADGFSAISGLSSYGRGAFLFETTNSVYTFGMTQTADGDGADGYMHRDITEQGTVYGSANQADYISVASTQAATCTVYEASDDSTVGTGTATSSNSEIYFLGFGTGDSNVYTTAAWYMECDSPVSAYYQDETVAEENLLSTVNARQFTYPTPSVGALGSEEESSDPIAHWKLDEKYGSTAHDNSKYDNDATISGAEWQDTEMCVSGGCLYFTGADEDYARTADAVTIPDAYTLSTWIKGEKTNQIAEQIYALGFENKSSLYIQTGTQSARGGILIRNAADTDYHVVHTNTDLLDNQWHNLTATVNTSTLAVNIYIDGQLKKTDTITDHYSGSDNLSFGTLTTTYGNFTGFIDEPKVYAYVRSADEIKQDYLNQNALRGAAVHFGPDYSYLSDGLVGFWRMDEGSGNANDSSGNLNTLTNVNTTTYTGGKYGNGADYESGSSQYHYIADNEELSITGDMTISAWINPESVTASTLFDIAGKWDGSNESYLLSQYGDEIRLYIDSSSNYETTDSTNLSTGTWYHVAASYNSTTQTVNLFVNGELQTSTTTGTIPSSIGDDAGRFQTGAEDSTTTAANFYDGIVDNVMLHNRTLTPREIQGLYNFGPSPVGYWKYDDIENSDSASDSSAYNNNLASSGSNYYGDESDGATTISSDTSLTNTADGDYVVREYSSLTINSGVTLTTQNRAKGLFIYVTGDATINGTLSMTDRGASADPVAAGVSSTGLRLPLFKDGETDTLSAADFAGAGTDIIAAVANQPGITGNGKIYQIPRTGATGATGTTGAGNAGSTGTSGQTGGGGSGGGGSNASGDGGDGTCFSGGAASGGEHWGTGVDASDTGGAGSGGSCYYSACGGGAGNLGGSGCCYGGVCSSGSYGNDGDDGTGGVVWLVVGGNLTIGASGIIQANGSNGGNTVFTAGGGGANGGGGSAGGAVMVLYNGTLSNSGTIEAAGGSGGTSNTSKPGGAGGDGSVIIEQLGGAGVGRVAGKYGKAANFDQSYLTTTDPSDFDFAASNDFTLTTWAKTSGDASSMFLISKVDGTNGGYKLYQDSSGNYCFDIDDDSSWTPDDSTCTSGTDYGDDEWHHISAIKNGTNSISIYIDGVYANSDTSIATTGTLVNSSDFYIGIDSDESTGNFTGQLDDTKIYNYARSPGQIVEDMNAGHPLGGSPISSMVARWKFDEGYGTTINDSLNPLLFNATGGTITYSGGKTIHTFTSDGAFEPNIRGEVEYLIVGGGGGGGGKLGGGGGAGGFLTDTGHVVTPKTYSVVVGAGGTGGPADGNGSATSGGDSSFDGVVSTGGGRGATATASGGGAEDGGSGGGGTNNNKPTPGNGTAGQGYAGGNATTANAGGGGGASEVGQNGASNTSGDGGNGLSSSISGASVTYAGGGGGGENGSSGYPAGAGGAGGGGAGDGNAGTDGLGGGGGGGNNSPLTAGGDGGDGIVIISYDTPVSTEGTGTITGATWVNNGKFGKALDFVAETDRVDFSTDYSEITEELTVSAWVQTHAAPIGDGRVIATTYDWDATAANIRGWNLGATNGSTDYLHMVVYDSSGNSASAYYSNFHSENMATWTHVAGVFKGSEYVRLYINGVLAAEDTSSVPAAIAYNGTNNLRIGSRSDSSTTGEWDGYIDEVKLYSAALTSDQILIDMNQGKIATMGTLSTSSSGTPSNSTDRSYCPPGDTTTSCGPVGEWKFDENTGTSTTYDTSENSNDGTMTGTMTAADWVNGKKGSALDFDGSNDYIDIGTGPTSVKSVEFWVKPTTTTEYFVNLTSTTDYIWSNAGTVTATGFTSPTIYVNGIQTTTLVSGVWQHVVVTTDTAENASNLDIGRTADTNYMEGQIDNVRLYDYARTPAQVAWSYNHGKPTGWWKLDECQGSTAYDSSGLSNNGTITIGGTGTQTTLGTCTTSGAWYNGASGKENGSLNFDGTDDYIDIGTGPTSVKAIEFWVKPTTTTEYFVNLTSTTDYIWSNAGTLTATGLTSPTIYINGVANTSLTTGVWQHIFITTDTAENASNLDIGRTADTNYMQGQIDNVKLYNYVPTTQQIKAFYNLGSIVNFSL